MLKRLLLLSAAVSLTLTFAGNIQAFDIGGAITKTTKSVGRGQIQKEYNKKLAKQKCKFKGDSTTEYSGCDIDKIISEMNAFRNAMEGSGLASDVDINVQTYGSEWNIARERAEFIRDKVRAQVGYWDFHVRYKKAPSNEVYFQVSAR